MNLSTVADDSTARTSAEIAVQRAEHLFALNAKNVIELCVGPSLYTLENSYNLYEIDVTGNDIDIRWKKYYPAGKWIIGDACKINCNNFDSVIFAPPLSKGCSGNREDSLSIDDVVPSYKDFLLKIIEKKFEGNIVMILPARSFATRKDRKQLYKLLSFINELDFNVELIKMRAGRRGIVKYIDLYLNAVKN